MGSKMRGEYRNGKASQRMIAGVEKSRETNCTSALKLIVGMELDDEGEMRERLECGHLGSYAFTLNTPEWHVLLGRKRRCQSCGTR